MTFKDYPDCCHDGNPDHACDATDKDGGHLDRNTMTIKDDPDYYDVGNPLCACDGNDEDGGHLAKHKRNFNGDGDDKMVTLHKKGEP